MSHPYRSLIPEAVYEVGIDKVISIHDFYKLSNGNWLLERGSCLGGYIVNPDGDILSYSDNAVNDARKAGLNPTKLEHTLYSY